MIKVEKLYPNLPFPVLPIGKAVKAKCFECGGSCRENQAMCHIMDCALWPYRLGGLPGGEPYRRMMTNAWNFYREARKELEYMGLSLEDMLGKPAPSRRSAVPPARKYWFKKKTTKETDAEDLKTSAPCHRPTSPK